MPLSLRILLALAMTVASGLLAAAPAQATPAPADDVTVAATCYFRVNQDGVRIRTKPNTSSTIVGLAYRGTYLRSWEGSYCLQMTGGSYTACGSSDRYWARVRYNGYLRYVASTCVTPIFR
ncbi:MAG: SH3 domain-containing protein [Micromonosporaceae bacterium]